MYETDNCINFAANTAIFSNQYYRIVKFRRFPALRVFLCLMFQVFAIIFTICDAGNWGGELNYLSALKEADGELDRWQNGVTMG